MDTGSSRCSPSSLERHPGEPLQPPLRLLERRADPQRVAVREGAAPTPGWLGRLRQALAGT